MKIDSANSAFSFQGDFSFQAFLEHGKKTASKNKPANEQASELSNKATDEIRNEARDEAARAQRYSQFQSGTLKNANPQDEASESNNNADNNTSSSATNSSSTFKMGGTSQALEAQNAATGNVSAKNLVEAQIQQAQETGGSNSGVTAGSRVSHGATVLSESMQARQAGKQAENQVLAEQMQRQGALVGAMAADIQVLQSSGVSESSALYIAGLRNDRRVDFEKKRSVYETAEEAFKKIEEENKEETKEEMAEVVSGESTEENTAEEGTITTDDSSTTDDSGGEITVGSGGDATITTGGSSDATITTGGSSGATLTTGTGDSSAETTTTATTSSSSSVSFKGISIRV